MATTEPHEGLQITSIPTKVAPLIKENVVNSEQPHQLGTTDMLEVPRLRFQLFFGVGTRLLLRRLRFLTNKMEFLVDSAFAVGAIVANNALHKLLDDDQPLSNPQEWWKWLSHGMVGAKGTKDATQLSGIVFDEVIMDLYLRRNKVSSCWN
ncbi:hypothetical protein CTI12_AA072100 [Artemisia annua]|uniref:Uncharacterized protein n=1 Tax=Artemisia annua TaxID=35608 RepID=A0A2U1Q5Q4_ARTAN|nr:hypothetical protein CTI12_AA072100 [Artemisia annua]